MKTKECAKVISTYRTT